MYDLNYRHLYYFWAVAKEGHLTRVASQLRVSQSALSSQIKLLEQDVGHPLFLRKGRALELTEVGRIMFGYSDSIFAMGAEMIAAIRGGEGQSVQQLRVGSVATLSRNFQESFLHPLIEMSNVQLVLESGSLDELLHRLSVHKLHLILSNRPVNAEADNAWRCRTIAKQQVCLVGPKRKSKREFRFPEDIGEAKLILPGYSSDIRTAFDILCEDEGLEINIFAEVDDMALLRLFAKTSGCIALAPAVVVDEELKTGVLEKYCIVPNVYEHFYAITTERHFQPSALNMIMERYSNPA